ncbi:nematode cuticle collagen domain protein [Cooperia oncophora]
MGDRTNSNTEFIEQNLKLGRFFAGDTLAENDRMDEKEIAGYRRLTFAGVTVAAVATVTSIIVVPLLFSYAQNVQSHLEVELKFCVMNTHNLFDEMRKVEVITGQKSRIKRGGYAMRPPPPQVRPPQSEAYIAWHKRANDAVNLLKRALFINNVNICDKKPEQL